MSSCEKAEDKTNQLTPPPEIEGEKQEPEKEQTPESEEDDDEPENCECCKLLHEQSTPLVSHANYSQSDWEYDKILCMFKLASSSKAPPPSLTAKEHSPSSSSFTTFKLKDGSSYAPAKVEKVTRVLDRFEEVKIWDFMGIDAKMYKKLPGELKRIAPGRIVFRKCAFRLHNTRHFHVPLVKKEGGVTKENVLKQTYEDDRKLHKKNQAFECPFEECSYSFQDPQDMRIHYMFDHEMLKVFCCGKSYSSYMQYLEHYVTTKNGRGHHAWRAQECWGCQKRFSDTGLFQEHFDQCDFVINQYACPDPLCKIRFDDLSNMVEHFYKWHDPAGALVWRGRKYPTLISILEDLSIIHQSQLIFIYPFKCVYLCQLCQIEFVTEHYYHEHVANHVNTPHFWLVPTILYCVGCHQRNCRFQRIKLLELLPKVITAARRITVEDCTKNPVFLLWRLYLSEEFIKTMEMALMKLVAEHQRLEEEERFLDQTGHPECEDKRLAYILNSLYFLYTVPYKSDKQIIQEKGFVFPKVDLSDLEATAQALAPAAPAQKK